MIRRLSRFAVAVVLLVGVQGCGDKKQEASEQPVRGLRAYKVAAKAESRVRRFPSVLQPADVSSLSFEIGGQLKAVTLTVGQKLQLGDVLAEIDPRSLQSQVDQASAGVQQTQAQLDNAEGDFQRKEELLKRGVATQAVFDQSRATLLSSRAQHDQARRQLELANHNLDRSKLLAPFAGTIARVEVKSFAQVAAGQPIATLYSDDSFEMSFLAPSATFQSLEGRTEGRRQDRRQAGAFAQRRDQGARVQSRAGVGLSGGGQAGQQRPGSERGNVRGSHDRRTLDRGR